MELTHFLYPQKIFASMAVARVPTDDQDQRSRQSTGQAGT